MAKKKKYAIQLFKCAYPGSYDKEGCVMHKKKNIKICLCLVERSCSYRKKPMKLETRLKKTK